MEGQHNLCIHFDNKMHVAREVYEAKITKQNAMLAMFLFTV
jgi:hypothetical protein